MLIEKIEELLNLVNQKNVLDKKLQSIQKNLTALQIETETILEPQTQAEINLKNLKKEIKLLDVEISSMVELCRLLKSRISSLSKLKEIDATKHELLMTQSKQEATEENLLKTLDKIEKIELFLKSNEKNIKEQISLVEEKKLNLIQEKNETEKKLRPIETALHEKSASLPEEFVNKYRRILSKLPNPIVTIENNCCSACYTVLTPQSIAVLKKSKLSECIGCGRVLFFKD